MSDKKNEDRMINVIRNAIVDKDIMNCLTPQDLSSVLQNAVASLTPSDIRGFIYRSISNRELEKGLIMADRAIDYALERHGVGTNDHFSEIVAAAVGTLSMMSASIPEVKEKTAALLNHPHPDVVVTVIENLGHSSSIDNFNRIADLILQSNPRVAFAATDYVEACARDAAFRKRREFYVIESSAEEFLRSALLRLERIYQQIKAANDKPEQIARRLAILVAMMYNEVLDSMDWRRFKREEVDERIYYALEQHLLDTIGPDAAPDLLLMLESTEAEEGMKRSALHTLGRLSKQESFRTKILRWLPVYLENENSQTVRSIAKTLYEICSENKPFTVLMFLPNLDDPNSNIIPRAAGAPLKKNNDSENY